MKKLAYLLLAGFFLAFLSCKKDDRSERFKMLTGVVWASDSLLANGFDASGAGGLLESFKGDAVFSEDGTGTFGDFEGTWRFNADETDLTIITDSLQFPIVTEIKELTKQSLKITTVIILPINPTNPFNIRMTFKAR